MTLQCPHNMYVVTTSKPRRMDAVRTIATVVPVAWWFNLLHYSQLGSKANLTLATTLTPTLNLTLIPVVYC